MNAKNQLTTVTFQYDTSTSYTHTISPEPDTTMRNTLISFSYSLTGLKPNTEYHYRIVAINESGTANGSDVAFITSDTTGVAIGFNPQLTYDSIYDNEGNKYKTIEIGTQTWMAENLRSTLYNDGTPIPYVPDSYAWVLLETPGYCWFNGDSVGYGTLYNWYTVETEKLCPQGWHVPSDDEWNILTDYLGGLSEAGGKLKEAGTLHWTNPNTSATNESGFSGLPSGYRTYGGGFNGFGRYGFWWTSTAKSAYEAWFRDVYFGYANTDRSSTGKPAGVNVRCVKD